MKLLRRFVWYIASRLLLLTLILSLMVTTFYYAMNGANIYIVLKDGMAQRAQYVMEITDDSSVLTKYFMNTFLDRDEATLLTRQGNSPYRYYDMVGIDHRLNLTWVWCWPWETTARADFIEKIPKMDGKAGSTYREGLLLAGGEEALNPPQWRNAKYRAILVKENGQWKVQSLTLLQYLDE